MLLIVIIFDSSSELNFNSENKTIKNIQRDIKNLDSICNSAWESLEASKVGSVIKSKILEKTFIYVAHPKGTIMSKIYQRSACLQI